MATKVEEELLYHTTKAGEIVRQLGLAALATVWLFRSSSSVAHGIPKDFRLAAILVIVALGIDAVHYAVGSGFWGWKTYRSEGKDEAASKKRTLLLMFIFVLMKIAFMVVAYAFLLRALASNVTWT